MLTVHIGLGKCASTSLQRFVFPELERIRKNIEFNNRKLLRLANKHHVVSLNSKERMEFDKILQNGKDHLISSENLVNWDPVYHEEAADLNLELFGKKANIIIIVRDSMDYFTSVYQQVVCEGNIIPTSDFFVRSDIYNKIKPSSLSKNTLKFLNTEEFSLKNIYDIYNERFDSVFFIPLSTVDDLLFIKGISNLTDDELKVLQDNFLVATRANKSYSSLAMKLTFKRKMILNLFGLESCESWNKIPLNDLAVSTEKNTMFFLLISIVNKFKSLPIKIVNTFLSDVHLCKIKLINIFLIENMNYQKAYLYCKRI
jgi:hypothetical protein